MPIERLKPTFSFDEDRLRKLERVIPEVFADHRIDWEVLRDVLGERVDDDERDIEHFGLFWPGKRQSRRLAAQVSKGTLIPVAGEGVKDAITENIFVEGENLEVLKLLQKSYGASVKMIYIDPPYNTGNDFIYKDDYVEPLETYLKRTRQMSDEGQLLTTNTKAEGRFHSNWLNMMYPRLLLARQLLRDDGVIVVSIDDNELHHLRQLMNEIFGEENFVNIVTVKAKPSAGASGGGEDRRLKKNVEFLLIYTKDRESEDGGLRFSETYEETDLLEHIKSMKDEGKSWKYTRALMSKGEKEFLKNIQDGKGDDIAVYRHKNYVMKPLTDLSNSTQKLLETSDSESNGEGKIYRKYFDQIFRDTNSQSSIRTRIMEAFPEEDGLLSIEYRPKSGKNKGKLTTVYYKGGKKDQIAWLSDIAEIKDDKLVMKGKIGTLWEGFNWNNVSKEGDMPFPNGKKPIAFIMQMLSLATSPENEDIVMDFFAGSGSTAHAVMAKNKGDNGNRRFFAIQFVEPASNNPEYSNVAEICKERLRRAIKALSPPEGELGLKVESPHDFGFKVFKLGKSNFRAWQDYSGEDAQQLESLFSSFESPLVEGWDEANVLTETLLVEGFPLHSKKTPTSAFSRNRVVQIASDFSVHQIYICLDARIEQSTVDQVAGLDGHDIFICLETALTDTAKVRLTDAGNVRTI